jgi:site-specific DNA-methyltransferase (adenine-specific)
VDKVHYSSAREDWATPWGFYNALNRIFGEFTIDTAASAGNTKCARYYDHVVNGLRQSWARERVWCNFPYGRKQTPRWLAKAFLERNDAESITLLGPARTDTKAFHRFGLRANEIVFVEGRIQFEGAEQGAPFPSVVLHYNGTDVHRITTIKADGSGYTG